MTLETKTILAQFEPKSLALLLRNHWHNSNRISQLTDKEEKTIKGLLENCIITDINSEIKNLTIEIRKKSNLKLPDSIIAASAYINKTPLLTADKQFKSLEELDIIIYEI
jgi:hypothetical protein